MSHLVSAIKYGLLHMIGGESNMTVKKYAGYDVPEMSVDGMKRVVERFNAGCKHICEGIDDGVECGGIDCTKCILNTCSYFRGEQKQCARAFADYARSKGFEITRPEATASEPLPEIEPGVTCEIEGRLFIVGGAVSDGWIMYPLGKGCILPEPQYLTSFSLQDMLRCGRISRVFTDGGPIPSCWLTEGQISAVANDDGARMALTNVRVWKWKEPPKPVREMTVDEISKALGVKVKVVGNEKADD